MIKQWRLRVDTSKAKYEFLEVESNGMERSRYNSTDLGVIWDGTLCVFNNRDILDGIDGEVFYYPPDQFSETGRVIINADNLSVQVRKNHGVVFHCGEYTEEMREFSEQMYRIITGDLIYV